MKFEHSSGAAYSLFLSWFGHLETRKKQPLESQVINFYLELPVNYSFMILADLDTISKPIVFLYPSLGFLLLSISFLLQQVQLTNLRVQKAKNLLLLIKY